MFASMLNKHTRFEKFISTLIIIAMSASFLLSGIPSGGGVRPAEAAVNSSSATKPDVNQGGFNQQAGNWNLSEVGVAEFPPTSGAFNITIRDNANLKTIAFSTLPSVSASPSVSGLNANLGPGGQNLQIQFSNSDIGQFENITISNIKYNVPPDAALGDIIVTVTGPMQAAFSDPDPGNLGTQISPNATVVSPPLPDPGKIVFNSNRDGNYEIYAMNSDGSGQTRLTINTAGDVDPAWSPDGSKIVFSSNRDGGDRSIYLMNADGTGQIRLTTDFDVTPDWSPDGTKIVFSSYRDGQPNSEIYVMNADGTGQTRLTNNSVIDADPVWSPDGSKIAYTQAIFGGESEIYVMNADGTGQTNLTNYPALLESYAAWSPDGTKIAFSRFGGGNFSDIYTMNPDGTGQTNLTNSPTADDAGSAWSPDGNKIAFLSDKFDPANGDIYVMNADGSSVTRITSNAATDSGPDWSPGSVPPPNPTNDVTNPDATDLTTLITLVNETKADFNTHIVLTDGVHGVPDTSSGVTSPNATDLATAITLVNQLKLKYEEHRWLLAGIHGAYDTINAVTSPGATDETTAITLANEIKGDYNAHRVLFGGVHGSSDTTPPTLVGSAPFDGAPSVSVSLPDYGIGINFSEPIQPADSTAISTQKIRFKKSDGTYLDEKLSNFSNVSGNDYKIDMTGGNLEYNTTYIVELSGLQDAASNIMTPTAVTFTTGSPPPVIPGNSFEFRDDFESYGVGTNPTSSYDLWQNPRWEPAPPPYPDEFKVSEVNGNKVLQYYWPGPSNHFPGVSKIYKKEFSEVLETEATFLRTQASMGWTYLLFAWQDSNNYYEILTNWDNNLYVLSGKSGYLGNPFPLWSDKNILDLDHKINVKRQGDDLVISVTRLDTGDAKSLTITSNDCIEGKAGFGFLEDWGGAVSFNADNFLAKGIVTETQGPSVTITSPTEGQTVSSFFDVFAQIDDSASGNSNIMEASLSIDGGAPQPMNTYDGTFDSPTEMVALNLNSTNLSNGNHTITVTGKDAANNWSSSSIVNINVNNVTPPDTQCPAITINSPIADTTYGIPQTFTINATVDDAATGGSNITNADFNVDGYQWYALNPVDGSFDSQTEDVEAQFDTTNPYLYGTGPHVLTVRTVDMAGNYNTSQVIFNVETLSTPTISKPDYGITVYGKDVSVEGNALPGATINIKLYDQNWNQKSYSTTADELGSFVKMIEASKGYNYLYVSQTYQGVTSPDTFWYFYGQLVDNPTTISGVVKSSSGSPVEGAYVYIYGDYLSSYYSNSTTTPANGNYSFTVPAGANYGVYAYRYIENYGYQYTNTANVFAQLSGQNYPANLEFNLTPPAVTSPTPYETVTTSPVNVTGEAEAGATVYINRQGYDPNWNWISNSYSGTADVNGDFTVPITPLQGYNYLYVTQSLNGKTSDTCSSYFNADISVKTTLSGQVTKNDGSPVEDATVYVYETSGWNTYYATTNGAGNYSINLPTDKSYAVYAYAYVNGKYVYADYQYINIGAETVQANFKFKLEAPTIDQPTYGQSLSTTPVTVSGTGSPGATVTIYYYGYSTSWWYLGQNQTTVVVDSNGSYQKSVTPFDGHNYIYAYQTTPTQDVSETTYSYFYDDIPDGKVSISGTVTNADGSAVEGATVYIWNDSGWNYYYATTAGDGSYTISGVPSNMSYSGYAYKYDNSINQYSDTNSLGIVSSNTTANFTFKPAAPTITAPSYGATLTNKSISVEGSAIANSTIDIVASYWNSATWQYQETSFQVTAGSNGSFQKNITVPSDGFYYLYVYQSVNNSKSDPAYTYFYVDSATTTNNVSGKATKADGTTAVEGATVYIYGYKANWQYFSTQTTTKSDGTYSTDLPSGGSYTIYGYKYDSASTTYKYTDYKYTGTLTGNQTNVNLSFSPEAPKITKIGTSSDANKFNLSIGATTPKVNTSPVVLSGTGASPSWKVYVYSYGYDDFGYYQYNYYETTANQDGTFTINNFKAFNDKNDISIYQYKPDYSQYSETGYTYFYGDGIATTASTATIKGKVTDSSTGNPVQGATVYIDNYTKRYEATTAFDGTYTKDVPAASYSTYYTAYAAKDSSDYMPSGSQTTWVTSGGLYTFDFTLGKVASDNGILTTQSKNKQGKIDYRMVFGASPAIANVDSSSSSFGLEVATGSDEYWATLSGDKGSAPGIWRMYNSDGTLKWDTSTKNDEARTSVAIVDIDGDGKLEIIGGTTSGNSVEVIDDADTSNPNVAQFLTGGFVHASPAVADVDPNTAGLEIAAASYSGKVFLLKYDGTTKTISELWNYKISNGWSTMASSPAIGDLDGDGKKEIVVGSSDGYIYALNRDGTLKWKYQTGGEINSSPALANIDGVAGREVIVGSNDGKVYAISTSTTSSGASNANLLWSYKTGSSVYSSPSVADINSDGKYEIVFGSNDGFVYALNTNGKFVWSKDTGSAVYSSPAIASRTSSQVAVYIGNDNGQLLTLKGSDGSLIDKFNTQAMIRTSPVVADIDGDGKLEVAFNDWRSGGDMTWMLEDNLSSVSTYANEWPMFGYDSARRAVKEITDAAKVAPAAPVITSPASPHYSNTTAVSISGTTTSDSILGVYSGSNLLMTSSISGTTAFSANLSRNEGTYEITAKATKDNLTSDSSKTLKLTVDTTKPAITVTGVAQSQSYSSGVKAIFSSSDATPTNTTATLGGNPYTSGTAITIGGWHTLVVTATDSANNIQTKTVTFEIKVDTVAPSITFVSPTPENNTAVYTSAVSIKATLSDEGSGINTDTVVLRKTAPATETIPIEIVSLNLQSTQPITVTQGSNTFEVQAWDLSGNTTTKTVKFYYKSTQPTMSIDQSSINPGDSIILTGSNFIVNDIVKLYRITAAGETIYIGSTTADPSGNFTYNYTTPAKISAGDRTFKAVGSYNTGASATVNVKLDFYPDSGSSFKQSDNPLIYVNGGEAAKSVTLTYKTEPDNGANPVSITPVTKETDTTWYYGTWTTNIVSKGSYKITATAKDGSGNTLATSTAIYYISEKDLSLTMSPATGSSVSRNPTLYAQGGADVTDVTFQYTTDGSTYTTIGTDNSAVDSFFDVFFDTSALSDGNIKIKAYPNSDSSKAVYANYTLVSDASLTLYPSDGSTINDNPTLAAKGGTDVSKVKFQTFDTSSSSWTDIGEDIEKDSASWFEASFDTSSLINGSTIKVRAVPYIGSSYDETKAVEATYVLDKNYDLALVSPTDNTTVEDNPYIWVSGGDGVTSVKAYISTDEGLHYQDALTVDENNLQTTGSSFYHYPNTDQWFYQIYTGDLGDSATFKVKLVPNPDTNISDSDAIYATYTTPAAGNLGIQLSPEDGSTLNKKPTLTAVGGSSVDSVEFYYSYYDNGENDWSDNIPLLSLTDETNIATKDSDGLFRLKADTSDIDEGQIRITAVSYNADKSDSDSVTNTYTIDKTAPKKPSNIQVTYSIQKAVEVHWTDPQNQADDRTGYNVYRKSTSFGGSLVGQTPIAFVQYDGNDSSYFYNDWETTEVGTYYYTVTTVDLSGNESAFFKEKSITISDNGNTLHNNGQSQNINPNKKGNGISGKVFAKFNLDPSSSFTVEPGDKQLTAVGESADTDSFDIAINGSDVKDSTVVSLKPINNESADTYSKKKILNDINDLISQANDEYGSELYRLGGTIFEAGSKTIQSGKVVSKLNSSSSDTGALMQTSYNLSSVPAGYYADLRYYDGGKIKTVTGQSKSGGRITARVRHFSSYFVVYVKKPTVKINGVTEGGYYKNVAPLYTTDGDKVVLSYALNGSLYSSATIGAALNTEGAKQLSVTATDQAGEFDTDAVNFMVDKTAPNLVFSSTTKADNSYVKGTITIGATTSDPTSNNVSSGIQKVELYDGSTLKGPADSSWPYSFSMNTTSLSSGKHTFKIKAYDNVGNTTYKTRVLYVDNSVPNISFDTSKTKVSGSYVKGTANFYVNSSDPTLSDFSSGSGIDRVELYRDSVTTACRTDKTSPYSLSVDTTQLIGVKHTFWIKAYDRVGNSKYAKNPDGSKKLWTFNVDNTTPAIPSAYVLPASPGKGTYAKLYYKVSDAISPKVNVRLEIRTTGGVVKSYSDFIAVAKGTLLYRNLKMPGTAGTYVYRVIAKDYAGNQFIKNVNFSVK